MLKCSCFTHKSMMNCENRIENMRMLSFQTVVRSRWDFHRGINLLEIWYRDSQIRKKIVSTERNVCYDIGLGGII